MAFDRQANRTPAAIGPLRIKLDDPTGVTVEMQALFHLSVLDQDGQVMKEIGGDLTPHLTPAQRSGLIQLMQDLRALAAAEILPV